jgi:hypothetical protein
MNYENYKILMEDDKGNLMKYIFLLKNEASIGVSE